MDLRQNLEYQNDVIAIYTSQEPINDFNGNDTWNNNDNELLFSLYLAQNVS